jgi:hypothetical protein
VTKTKYLQIATTMLRWTAFAFMVALSIRRLLDRYRAYATSVME